MWKPDLFILGAKLDNVPLDQCLKNIFEMVTRPFYNGRDKHQIITLNPEIVLHSVKSNAYRKIIGKASLSLCDGIGLKLASFLFGQKVPTRIAGVDLMVQICQLAALNKWPVFFLGGLASADLAARRLKKLFPTLVIAGTDPGLMLKVKKSELIYDPTQNSAIKEKIRRSGAAIVFVAFGAPKQEYWIAQNLQDLLPVKLAMGVGGAFDYISGRVSRAPAWMRDIGLEWLYRLVQQPFRLRRVFNATFKFVFFVVMCKLRIWLKYRKNVVGMIVNKAGQILVVSPKRHEEDVWQFPQGGVDRFESSDKAIFREMREELSTDKFEILKKIKNIHAYVWPLWAQCSQCYKGQKQTLYILKFLGEDNDFNLQNDDELRSWKWVGPEELVETVDVVRRPLIIKALEEFKKL